jgi:hypothetical protein
LVKAVARTGDFWQRQFRGRLIPMRLDRVRIV